MRGQKDLRTVKKRGQQDRNQGKDWYKMLQNCQMTDLYEKLDQL